MRSTLIIFFLALSFFNDPIDVVGQIRFGAGLQVYPAGVIGTGEVIFPASRNLAVSLSGGYNATDRRDFGKHDDETGGGPGLAVALDRYFSEGQKGFFLGARADVWFLEIDWENDGKTGTTSATVFQPTGVLGYRTGSPVSRVAVDFTLALGAEINVNTSGEPVGEGAIFLAGIALVFQGSQDGPH